jgi:hypothetical protein
MITEEPSTQLASKSRKRPQLAKIRVGLIAIIAIQSIVLLFFIGIQRWAASQNLQRHFGQPATVGGLELW